MVRSTLLLLLLPPQDQEQREPKAEHIDQREGQVPEAEGLEVELPEEGDADDKGDDLHGEGRGEELLHGGWV